ncbi:chaplin [Streptomyces sp. NPDC048442]|uniref:chaplin n=1 Tax=Streptomyces sp. NPDC048442 TaxID=3154823 RepID=UPI00342707D0
MRIRIALATTVLAAATVIGAAGAAAADPPPPPTGVAEDPPGVLSGDVVEIPINAPANVCEDTIDIIGLLNPASNNNCRTA